MTPRWVKTDHEMPPENVCVWVWSVGMEEAHQAYRDKDRDIINMPQDCVPMNPLPEYWYCDDSKPDLPLIAAEDVNQLRDKLDRTSNELHRVSIYLRTLRVYITNLQRNSGVQAPTEQLVKDAMSYKASKP